MVGSLLSSVVALAIGVLAGLGTGFYFERRAKKQIQELEAILADTSRQNHELKGLLRETVLSGGGEFGSGPARGDGDLRGLVTAWVVKTQDASGRVDRRHVIAHFAQEGADPHEVEAALAALCTSGAARQEAQWLQMM